MSILVAGSVALDTVTTPFGAMTEGLGGSATHFSVSASYFTDVCIVAVVGDDFPKRHIEFLKSRKINTDGLERAPGLTFRWTGKYEYDLNNAHTIKTDLNVFEKFRPKIPESHRSIRNVFLANIDPELQLEVLSQVDNPEITACDTMNFWINGKRTALEKTLGKVNILTINEAEARLLSGESNLIKAAKKIKSMGPEIIVIKRGEYGALLLDGHSCFSAPGLPLEDIKDPTGAGDSFAGGFMGYLDRAGKLSAEALKQAVIFGSVMASFNVEAFSCDRLRTLTQVDIRRRYAEFKKLSHFEEPGMEGGWL